MNRQDLRQALLDLLGEYRELETPANPDLLKLHIEAYEERIMQLAKSSASADDTSDQANTKPHRELAPQTTPSKAVDDALKEILGYDDWKYTDKPHRLHELITTTLTQHHIPTGKTDFDERINDWLKKNNVGINQHAELMNLVSWMNAELNLNATKHAIAQHNEALLAATDFVKVKGCSEHPLGAKECKRWFRCPYIYEHNQAIDQVTAIIRGDSQV